MTFEDVAVNDMLKEVLNIVSARCVFCVARDDTYVTRVMLQLAHIDARRAELFLTSYDSLNVRKR
jgi:hypothetical protein